MPGRELLGQSLGNYRIESRLGAGGMGVVYRATDSRLGRQVAIKLLREERLDAQRISRFEREARVLASLNHPNIAAIHGFEEAAQVKFLVLEYVPGDTLAERLAHGPLPLRDALDMGRQLAEALETAHNAAVIHRDLKPANIKLTDQGTVKVLDFGLAKALDALDPLEADNVTVRATAAAVTQPGTVMGTVAYMSPEQASGKPVDRRTDVWAFGCVLYEALTGHQTFQGASTTEVLIGILDREPDWNVLPAHTPENVRSLLRRCLAKDPRARLRDMGDARLELEDALLGRPAVEPRGAARRGLGLSGWAAVAAAFLLGAGGAALWTLRGSVQNGSPRVVRFSFELPAGSKIRPTWGGGISFSPDSKTLLYGPSDPPPVVTRARRLDELTDEVFLPAKGFGIPSFSPDSRWIMAPDPARGSLVKVPVSGGAPIPLASFDMLFRGQWGADGYIYWTDGLINGIVRTPDAGGRNEPLTELDLEKHERTHRFVRLLPATGAMMFTVASGEYDSFDDARIDTFQLHTKNRKPLVHGGTDAHYSPTGHIVYARGGSLYAVPFDPRTLAAAGTPVKVLDGVLMSTSIGNAYFDISPRGDLAYAAGPAENGERLLYWVDRQGQATRLPLAPKTYLNPRISPDGKQLAVEIEGVNHDLYLYDFAREVMSRLTNDGISHAPIWSPDGKRIAFRTWEGGKMQLAWMPSDRSAPDEMLFKYPAAWHSAVSFSPDGKYLAFDQSRPRTEYGIWMLPLTGERKPIPFVRSKVTTGAGKFSPDGSWIVYCSLESGKAEIYVQPWPGPGPKLQISSDGGTDPLWRKDGMEIFYRNGSKMMAVPVRLLPSLQAGKPQALWEGEYTHGLSSSCGVKGATNTGYDVSPDGRHFLMIKDRDQNTFSTRIVVVVNWAEELKSMMAEPDEKKR